MKKFVLLVAVLAIFAAVAPEPAQAQTMTVYVPLAAPCRIYDSRVDPAAPGTIIPVGGHRDVNIVGTAGPFPGGPAGGCGIPGYVESTPGSGTFDTPVAIAVAMNITATGTTNNGNFAAVPPSNPPAQTTSIINYKSGPGAIANAAIVALDSDTTEGADIRFVQGGPGGAHVVVDVAGYFVELP